MGKLKLRQRFLAGVLAMSISGATTSALALQTTNNYEGETTTIEQSIDDEDTLKVKEALGEEYVAFLDSIGVKIVEGNLQVETVEQFKAIGDYINEGLKENGCEEMAIYDMLLMYNFNYLSDELKKELRNTKTIAASIIDFPNGFYKGERENMRIFIDNYLKFNDGIKSFDMEKSFFEKDKILFAKEAEFLCNEAFSLIKKAAQTGHFNTFESFVDEYVDYLNGKQNKVLPIDYTALDGSLYRIILYVNDMVCNAPIHTGTYFSKKYSKFMSEYLEKDDYVKSVEYQKYIKENYPTLDKTLVNKK